MSDGGHRGAKRAIQSTRYPRLMPHEQLTESKESYERRAAMEIIKAIHALGRRIVKT